MDNIGIYNNRSGDDSANYKMDKGWTNMRYK